MKPINELFLLKVCLQDTLGKIESMPEDQKENWRDDVPYIYAKLDEIYALENCVTFINRERVSDFCDILAEYLRNIKYPSL